MEGDEQRNPWAPREPEPEPRADAAAAADHEPTPATGGTTPGPDATPDGPPPQRPDIPQGAPGQPSRLSPYLDATRPGARGASGEFPSRRSLRDAAPDSGATAPPTPPTAPAPAPASERPTEPTPAPAATPAAPPEPAQPVADTSPSADTSPQEDTAAPAADEQPTSAPYAAPVAPQPPAPAGDTPAERAPAAPREPWLPPPPAPTQSAPPVAPPAPSPPMAAAMPAAPLVDPTPPASAAPPAPEPAAESEPDEPQQAEPPQAFAPPSAPASQPPSASPWSTPTPAADGPDVGTPSKPALPQSHSRSEQAPVDSAYQAPAPSAESSAPEPEAPAEPQPESEPFAPSPFFGEFTPAEPEASPAATDAPEPPAPQANASGESSPFEVAAPRPEPIEPDEDDDIVAPISPPPAHEIQPLAGAFAWEAPADRSPSDRAEPAVDSPQGEIHPEAADPVRRLGESALSTANLQAAGAPTPSHGVPRVNDDEQLPDFGEDEPFVPRFEPMGGGTPAGNPSVSFQEPAPRERRVLDHLELPEPEGPAYQPRVNLGDEEPGPAPVPEEVGTDVPGLEEEPAPELPEPTGPAPRGASPWAAVFPEEGSGAAASEPLPERPAATQQPEAAPPAPNGPSEPAAAAPSPEASAPAEDDAEPAPYRSFGAPELADRVPSPGEPEYDDVGYAIAPLPVMPQEEPVPLAPPEQDEAPKRSRRTLVVLLSILGVVVLAAAGYFSYQQWFTPDPIILPTPTATAAAPEPTAEPIALEDPTPFLASLPTVVFTDVLLSVEATDVVGDDTLPARAAEFYTLTYGPDQGSPEYTVDAYQHYNDDDARIAFDAYAAEVESVEVVTAAGQIVGQKATVASDEIVWRNSTAVFRLTGPADGIEYFYTLYGV